VSAVKTPLLPSEVGPLLAAAAQRRARIAVRGEGQILARGTMRDVTPDGEVLVDLDPDRRGAERWSQLREVEVECVVDGVPITIETDVVPSTGGGSGGRLLRLAPPAAVTRLQRREFYRVAAEAGSELVVVSPDATRLLPLVDVSGGGVGVTMPVGDPTLRPGARIENAQVRLPGEDVVVSPGVVRYVRPLSGEASHLARVGIELLPASQAVRERLFRAVARRERDLLGKRRHQRAVVPAGSVVIVARDPARARVRRMLDVSAGGLLFELEPTADADLSRNTALTAVEVRLPGERPIGCTAVVRRITRGHGESTCAIELGDLDAADRERLERFVRHAPKSGTPPRRAP
jgi:c-di-GMP-binding flagellar brake protein YcgR